MIKPSQKIYIDESELPDAGRGVIAGLDIQKDQIIEACPVLVLPKKDYPLAKQTILRNYYFLWSGKTAAICFGDRFYYNHSYEHNATYKKNINEMIIEFVAIKKINTGDEITVNYNYGNSDDKRDLWIEDIEGYNIKTEIEE